jgi:hypothetical protein
VIRHFGWQGVIFRLKIDEGKLKMAKNSRPRNSISQYLFATIAVLVILTMIIGAIR